MYLQCAKEKYQQNYYEISWSAKSKWASNDPLNAVSSELRLLNQWLNRPEPYWHDDVTSGYIFHVTEKQFRPLLMSMLKGSRQQHRKRHFLYSVTTWGESPVTNSTTPSSISGSGKEITMPNWWHQQISKWVTLSMDEVPNDASLFLCAVTPKKPDQILQIINKGTPCWFAMQNDIFHNTWTDRGILFSN